MLLMITGTGVMGSLVRECAKEDPFFDRIICVEPKDKRWPEEKADLIIDFSHPEAMKDIYEYCRGHGGNIPVIIGTTGQRGQDEEMIKLLAKICPVERRSNFSRGIAAVCDILPVMKEMMQGCDMGVAEIHHTRKKDAPSGTAVTLCDILEIPPKEAVSLRLGNFRGEHKVWFALEDEVVEITHRAFSRKIFAKGAIEAGKKMVQID